MTAIAAGNDVRRWREPPVVVRDSPIHGRGAFAAERLEPGDVVIDYRGAVVPWSAIQDRDIVPGHTFLFDLGDGRVIDGGNGGNAARWINHGCEPNCEAIVDGDRVVIHALRPVEPGEELLIDYQLIVEGEVTPALREMFGCRCGAAGCRTSMLRG